jgi:hypothetical protein
MWDARTKAWVPRNFVGTKWQIMRSSEAAANQINTYRVLLTRARYETLIFVPMGDRDDPTRPPALYDGIADFLAACGAQALDDEPVDRAADVPEAQPALL